MIDGETEEDNSNRGDSCPISGIRSGIPVIGIGIFLILIAVLPLCINGIPPVPLPAMVIFSAAGIFIIWIGISQ
jgi:hypothetical protein